ncbi:Tellurium resistance protein terZ [Duganella sp. Leaf126]|uniref:TerD family protein n=1 Tax=Duganella sp. Leaf126 TaxID=1736266 RepID=UPI0006FD0E05|nr:TerD family protein [Duganella sp. Leaf126]KQQ47263.1 Tellurium resistance protein terZ [Duganella sp. Leaf126]
MSVNLSKGQKINLEKEGGGALGKVTMGLGWDAIKTKGFLGFGSKSEAVDLDASVVMFDDTNRPLDVIWFRQLRSKDGSVVHTGDNRTGAGDGDDEQINVDLTAVPAGVKSLVFTVNSFTGQTFSQVENAYCRLIDANNGQEVARFNLSVQGPHSAQIMAKVYRHNGAWKMHAIGENGNGRTFDDLLPQISAHL